MKVVNEIMLQARRLDLQIICKNGLIEKLLNWTMLGKNCFLKFKRSKLHIDEENYKKVKFKKESKYQVQNLIKKSKREFYETNLRQKINKAKELWKTLKSMGLPSKAVTASRICLKDKKELVFNATKKSSIFKNYFSSLTQNLVSKLPL